MASKEQPRCVEVSASFSSGGKVSIEKYDWSSDWHTSMSRRYEIPEGWSEEEIEAFQYAKWQELYDVVDAISDEEAEKRRRASSVPEVRLSDDD